MADHLTPEHRQKISQSLLRHYRMAALAPPRARQARRARHVTGTGAGAPGRPGLPGRPL